MVDLRTIPGVELVKTGTWDISTGRWKVTPELIAAAVAAHNSGALPKPILKLGHVDERFDGEPALGWVDNLRTADGGNTLVGDFMGCPAWLADIAASAYPNRSVEAVHGLTLPDGTVHPLALTAVALLGVTRPGIGTLATIQDVAALYGVSESVAQNTDWLTSVAASTGTPVTLRFSAAAGPGSALTPRQRVHIRAAAARRRHRRAQAALDIIDRKEPS